METAMIASGKKIQVSVELMNFKQKKYTWHTRFNVYKCIGIYGIIKRQNSLRIFQHYDNMKVTYNSGFDAKI